MEDATSQVGAVLEETPVAVAHPEPGPGEGPCPLTQHPGIPVTRTRGLQGNELPSWRDTSPHQLPAWGAPKKTPDSPTKGTGGQAARLDPLPKMKPRRHLLHLLIKSMAEESGQRGDMVTAGGM